MALNLSTLTNSATSGDVLAEALTTADFLEPVPVLRNLARGSQKGGDAKQDVALNQPKALPLIDGDGYLYASGVSGNYGEADSPILPSTGDFDLTIDFVWKDTAFNNQDLFAQYDFSFIGRFFIYITPDGALNTFWNGGSDHQSGAAGSIIEGRRHVARFNRTGNTFAVYLDGVSYYSYTVGSTVPIAQVDSTIGNGSTTRTAQHFKGAIFSVTEGSNTNIDFTATNVRHGDTKFKCATGQVVTINQAGNDPATVIKKPVLRFANQTDGSTNIYLAGLLNQTVTGGYMFASFSVLGDGGYSFARLLGLNSSGSVDSGAGGVSFRRFGSSQDWMIRYNENNITGQSDFFDDERGDYLLEAKVLTGSQKSKINNADEKISSVTGQLSVEEFTVASYTNANSGWISMDLEYLALFPATITDAQADAVRNYINKRNNVFYRWDTDGFYFFDPLSLAADAPVASWNGQIVGSDNDANLTITQSTANSQPDRLAPDKDGMVVRFNDNNDHLDVPAGFVEPADGSWQIVGTSLGTFAYKLNNTAVTELNLLGNLGDAAYRQAGDLYGVILLPESATGKDIEDARKLLIDRGAADGTTASSLNLYFYRRRDIVDFKGIDFSSATSLRFTWFLVDNITTFPSLDFSNVLDCYAAWEAAYGLVSFNTTDISNCSTFNFSWRSCTSLTSFPADAKLGTDATNVSFNSAWQSSGLTSFSTPLPTATTLTQSFQACSSLTQFTSNLSSALTLVRTWRNSGLTSFSVELPSARFISQAWEGCSDLVDFSAEVFDNWNPSSITSEVFNLTWSGCTSLTAQSVENILTSIDASGKYATTNGASGGPALADAGIDIDYNGDPLTAATTAAIDSLSGKGWQVYINGELVIPNILDLQPAAAYSLRSFDADADPNVVNVRRSSDNATSDFTASEVSDGTLTDWVGAGNDGHVTTWYDQGGTNHATQTSTSAQPKIVDGGALVTEGGKAALDFDGVDDVFNMPAGMISSLSDIFVSAVFTGSDGSNDYGVVLGEPTERIYVPYVTSNILYIGYSDSAVKLSDGAYSDGLQLVTLSVDDTTASGFRNSSAFSIQPTASASSSPPVITTRGDRIGSFGSSVFTSMNFSEVIIFNTDQVANRTGIENNINDHFDIYS